MSVCRSERDKPLIAYYETKQSIDQITEDKGIPTQRDFDGHHQWVDADKAVENLSIGMSTQKIDYPAKKYRYRIERDLNSDPRK